MGSRVLLSVGEDSALLGPTLNIQLPLNKLTMQQLLAEVLLFFFLYTSSIIVMCIDYSGFWSSNCNNKKIVRILSSNWFYIKYWEVEVMVMEMITNFIYNRICRFSKLREGKQRFIDFLLQGCVVKQNSSAILCSGIVAFLLMRLNLTG